MPFKKNADGTLAQDADGNPIFINPDGTEKPFDVDARLKQISELTEKSSKRKQELDELRSKYSLFDDIPDLKVFREQAKKDAEAVAAMADKDRENEARIQQRITEAVKAATSPLETEVANSKAELAKAIEGWHKSRISNAFGQSKYAAEKLVSPALARQLFEGNFYVKDDCIIGRDKDGKDIYGPEGVASFDEALSRMVEASPFKENILAPTPGGSGSKPDGNQHKPNGMTPEQIGNLSPDAYMRLRRENKI